MTTGVAAIRAKLRAFRNEIGRAWEVLMDASLRPRRRRGRPRGPLGDQPANVLGRCERKRFRGETASAVRSQAADDLLDAGERARRGRELAYAEPDEHRDGDGVAGGLAADADPDAVLVRGLDDAGDQPEDGGMERVGERRDARVQA